MTTTQLHIGRPPRMSRRQLAALLFTKTALYTVAFVWIFGAAWWLAADQPLVAVLFLYLASVLCGPQRPKRPARPWSTAPSRMSTLLRRRLAGARAGAAVTSSPHE